MRRPHIPSWLLVVALSLLAVSAPGAQPGLIPGDSTAPRIEWDQSAPSAAVLNLYEFRLYVDQVAQPLADVRCLPTEMPFEFVCTAPLPSIAPGSRIVTIAAAAGDRESAQSAPVAVSEQAVSVPTTDRSIGAGQRRLSASPAPVCFSGGESSCFDVRRVGEVQHVCRRRRWRQTAASS